jgi:hypothetical protein
VADTVSFAVDDEDRKLIGKIAERAYAMDREANGRRAASKIHHNMNVTACHANGNPLRLRDLLAADDFNFAHDVFGIDRHIDRDTGKLLHHFSPRFSRRESVSA